MLGLEVLAFRQGCVTNVGITGGSMVVSKSLTNFVSLHFHSMVQLFLPLILSSNLKLTWYFVFAVDGEMDIRKIKSGPLSEDGEVPPPGMC